MNKNGPTKITSTSTVCGLCAFHTQHMVMSGEHPIYEHYCHEPRSMAVARAHPPIFGEIHGREIGKTDNTPDWCPLLPQNEKAIAVKSKIIVFDYETGGTLPKHPNIQLAAIAVDEQWNELDSFESKIAFDPAECETKALEINHYDAKAWEDAPRSDEVFAKFSAFLSKHATMEQVSKRTGRPYTVARLAAYNFPFDKERLWAMADGCFVPAYPLGLDILQRAMWYVLEHGLKVENHQLGTIAKALGIDAGGAHDALADVRISAQIAKKIGQKVAV